MPTRQAALTVGRCQSVSLNDQVAPTSGSDQARNISEVHPLFRPRHGRYHSQGARHADWQRSCKGRCQRYLQVKVRRADSQACRRAECQPHSQSAGPIDGQQFGGRQWHREYDAVKDSCESRSAPGAIEPAPPAPAPSFAQSPRSARWRWAGRRAPGTEGDYLPRTACGKRNKHAADRELQAGREAALPRKGDGPRSNLLRWHHGPRHGGLQNTE